MELLAVVVLPVCFGLGYGTASYSGMVAPAGFVLVGVDRRRAYDGQSR